jgi:hypothetical protein
MCYCESKQHSQEVRRWWQQTVVLKQLDSQLVLLLWSQIDQSKEALAYLPACLPVCLSAYLPVCLMPAGQAVQPTAPWPSTARTRAATSLLSAAPPPPAAPLNRSRSSSSVARTQPNSAAPSCWARSTMCAQRGCAGTAAMRRPASRKWCAVCVCVQPINNGVVHDAYNDAYSDAYSDAACGGVVETVRPLPPSFLSRAKE